MIRCEISLDDGATWRLADISRFEEPNWAAKHWCWVHFSLEVPIGASLACRCATRPLPGSISEQL